MATKYPLIANCNYESQHDLTIHRARKYADQGVASKELIEALATLEWTLASELTQDAQYLNGELSRERLDKAENDVIRANTD